MCQLHLLFSCVIQQGPSWEEGPWSRGHVKESWGGPSSSWARGARGVALKNCSLGTNTVGFPNLLTVLPEFCHLPRSVVILINVMRLD